MPGAIVKRTGAAARYLDVVVVLIATPVALVCGVPTLGLLVGVAAWLAQRVLAQLDRRWISSSTQPRTQLGLNLFEAFGRIWLLAGAIVIAGVVGGRADGLTAAVVIFAGYSVAFVIRILSGPPNRQVERRLASPPVRRPSGQAAGEPGRGEMARGEVAR